ncbi:hypothetical protein BE15_29725 [Sorangium cellulosum]|uniref:Uncharacterized protein n=1 Tax=Sorangium cellulosum TaxID=56 RepID=A0A150QHU8_SORCE|nr:hypothetical protein BE15_29725 [Sorangium cellulosum]
MKPIERGGPPPEPPAPPLPPAPPAPLLVEELEELEEPEDELELLLEEEVVVPPVLLADTMVGRPVPFAQNPHVSVPFFGIAPL